ncbi:hypothetical protein AKJ16_DCAP07777 [Drosera capensis]
MANWLQCQYPLSFSSWLPPHNKDPIRTGPTAAHFTTVAASLRLGHFLRRRLLHGHNFKAFSSLLNCFAGIQEGSRDGKGESSSSGMEESLSPGTGQSSSSGLGESSSSGKSRKNLFEGRHWTNTSCN